MPNQTTSKKKDTVAAEIKAEIEASEVTVKAETPKAKTLADAQTAKKQVYQQYRNEDKVPIYLSPTYRAYFGNVMPMVRLHIEFCFTEFHERNMHHEILRKLFSVHIDEIYTVCVENTLFATFVERHEQRFNTACRLSENRTGTGRGNRTPRNILSAIHPHTFHLFRKVTMQHCVKRITFLRFQSRIVTGK